MHLDTVFLDIEMVEKALKLTKRKFKKQVVYLKKLYLVILH